MSKPEETAETLQGFSLVYQRPIVFCDAGEDVVLSCHLQPAISAVSMEIIWKFRADLICHYKDGEVTVSSGYEDRVNLSLHDLHNGNVSLTLKDVRASQSGLYICEVTYKGQAKREYIFLHVRSRNFRLVAEPFISAHPGEDVILPVHLRPETSAVSMKIQWFKGPELIYQYNYGRETANSAYENRVSLSTQELERGNLSLTLRNVRLPDSAHYICITSHDESVMTAVVHLRVRDLKSEYTQMRSKYLENVLRELKNDLPTKLEESLTLLKEALDHCEKEKKRKKETDDGTFRRSNSMEGIPPLMENENPLERNRVTVERHNRYFFSLYDPTARLTQSVEEIPLYNPTLRRIGSMEGIPPLMSNWISLGNDDESDSDTHAPDMQVEMESNSPTRRDTRQERPFPAITSQVQPTQRTSESVSSPIAATQPPSHERRQESIATEQEISTVQSLREISQTLITLQRRLSLLRLELEELQRNLPSVRVEASRTQIQESVGTGTSQLITASSSAAAAARTQTQVRAGPRTSQLGTPSTSSAAARTPTQERVRQRTQSPQRRQESREGNCNIL